MVLLCAGAACSLAGVWALAGLSERSSLRANARVLLVAGIGLLGLSRVYFKAPGSWRGELLLPMLFSAVGVLALAAGAGKLDAALADKDGPRAVRRAAGLIAGTFLSMAAVAAVSLELFASSVVVARFAWACTIPLVGAAVLVFVGRTRLAGAGALALGRRGLVLGAVGLALLGVARLGVSPLRATPEPAKPHVEAAAAPPSAPPITAPEPTASAEPAPSAAPAASTPPAASAEPAASAAPSASAAAAPGAPGELQVEGVVTKGMLEADVRGGVARRIDRLQACMTDPKNQQSGALTLRIGVDASGSVGYARPTGGELVGTPLATCLLPAFYKMGFAAPPSNGAYFEITLRAPPR